MARPQKFRHSREALNAPEVAAKLAGLVLDIEALRAKRKQIDDQIAAGYDAVDDAGFEKKFVRKTIALRAKEEGARADDEQGLEAYEFAVEKGVSLVRTRRERNSYAEATGAEPKLTTIHDPETGEILTQEQPSSQDAEVVNPLSTAQPAPAESMGDEISAPIPHSPANQASQALQADKTSEAVAPPAVSLVAPSAMSARTKGDVIRLMRPFCQHADDLGKCGGQGTKHCNDCEQIKRTAQVSA